MRLPTTYQEYIHLSRYARWDYDQGRRETWDETVCRYFDFFTDHLKEMHDFKFSASMRKELEDAVLDLRVMPSMRCLMTAGEALKRENIAGYNCSYVAVNRVHAFDEILYILMNGTGVGFSVERQHTNQLPHVADEFHTTETTISVADSKLGWAKGLKELIAMLYVGQIPRWDLSKIRPAGAPLKTFGGRASGPEPLESLFNFAVNIFQNAPGRKLSSIECHDLVCKIAEIVVVGGVRRSALISLSNLNDETMRHAKSGQWWLENGQRALANNSGCYSRTPDMGLFMSEWKSLYDSKSGERGIFNRLAAKNKAAENERRDTSFEFGTNPCCEIILRPYQFCNLTEVVIRATDNKLELQEKVRLATILGTFQSTLTDLKYLRKIWKDNTEAERLLGVSLTGIMDNILTSRPTKELLSALRSTAVETNKVFAKKLKIQQSAAITCVKPSGTVSQLVDSASGIHSRHSDYYIRTVRGDSKDPLTRFLIDKGIPHEPDITKPSDVMVFSFPIKSPDKSITRNDMSAIEQLELWLMYQRHWCEHKPSVTISVRENEWLKVGSWVYENFDEIAGISFLPHAEHSYKQAPYQDIDKSEYAKLKKAMPFDIDFTELQKYESEDNTTGSQELACVGNVCELVDTQKFPS